MLKYLKKNWNLVASKPENNNIMLETAMEIKYYISIKPLFT